MLERFRFVKSCKSVILEIHATIYWAKRILLPSFRLFIQCYSTKEILFSLALIDVVVYKTLFSDFKCVIWSFQTFLERNKAFKTFIFTRYSSVKIDRFETFLVNLNQIGFSLLLSGKIYRWNLPLCIRHIFYHLEKCMS